MTDFKETRYDYLVRTTQALPPDNFNFNGLSVFTSNLGLANLGARGILFTFSRIVLNLEVS